jgi:hypothetical protein
MKKLFLIMLVGMLFLFSFNFITASTSFPPVQQGNCITVKQSCSSCTYLNLSIAYPNSTLAISNQGMSSQGAGLWTYEFCDTSTIGIYEVAGEGDISGTATSFSSLSFQVTQNGEVIDQSKTNLSVLFTFILLVLFVLSLIGTIKFENYIGKFVCYWISHLLLIALSFTAWTTSSNYLGLSGGLTGIFKILFYFSIIAVFPMIILSLSWIFYIHTFNEHFEKLISKGIDTETAFAISNKKTGGWFSGK